MTYTDCGTKVKQNWMPLAMANGVEWAKLRKGQKDRFDCLYRKGLLNKCLWYMGNIISPFIKL